MGVISPKAKNEFLERTLDNWDWLKKESKRDLGDTIQALKPTPKFGKVKLWFHQRVCFLLMVYMKRFMLFLDMGGGKTILVLMMIRYLKRKGVKVRALVFVPYVITTDTWLEETEKWTKLTCVPLTGTGKENLDAIQNLDADLFVICYQSAVAMLTRKDQVDAKGKTKWTMAAADVRKKLKGINFIAMDEIHKCKNVNSITYRLCRAIAKEAEWCYGLTGTPFGKNLEDLWAQFFLVDLGETLGPTLGLFRSVFFREVQRYFGGGFDYKFIKKLMPELKRVIKNRSIRFRIEECHDMPKKKFINKYVQPSADVALYYNKVVEAMNTLSHGKVKYQQLEQETIKLRQLASGFMTLKGDDSTKVEHEFPVNPKLDALQEIVESMPEDSKMIVFHNYRFTNHLISKRLKEMKIPHARVFGGIKNPLQELRRFKKDPKCRVLVVNDQAGSSSQNLQMANYVVFFEQPRSAIDRQQAERRAWRPGQKKRVFFFELLMKGTVDEKQLASNKEGKNLLKSILDGSLKIGKLL